jgi:NitT/TauT family transport system substrate-binding protein
VPALRQIVDVALRVWLTKNGGDPTKVQVVESAFAEMGPGIDRGTFAGAIISEPSLTNALKHNDVRVLGDPYAAIAPEYAVAGWVTTTAFQQKNPELVRRVAAALMESARWANAHHTESALTISRVTKVDVDTIRNGMRPTFGEELRAGELQPALDAALKYGFLTRPVTANEMFGH